MERFCWMSDSFLPLAFAGAIFLRTVLPPVVLCCSYCVTLVRFTPVFLAVEADVFTPFLTLPELFAAVFLEADFFSAELFVADFFAAVFFTEVRLLGDFFAVAMPRLEAVAHEEVHGPPHKLWSVGISFNAVANGSDLLPWTHPQRGRPARCRSCPGRPAVVPLPVQVP